MDRTAADAIFPTLSRVKVSSKLSYPVGAEQITEQLQAVDQASELGVHFFCSKFVNASRGGKYEFLRVEYLNKARPAEKWPIHNLYGRLPQQRWEIVVQPVPRDRRRKIRDYILQSKLPAIGAWLLARTQLDQQGSDVLAFFHDEEVGESFPLQLTRLEPRRG